MTMTAKHTPGLSKTVQVRMAWRDLQGQGSPAHWMSDDELERLVPRMVTVKEVRDAVRLANAAQEMLEALRSLVGFLEDYPHQFAVDISGYEEEARAAIAKATGEGA